MPRPMVMSTSVSPATTVTENSRAVNWMTCKPARASRWRKPKITQWILHYGKLQNQVKSPGTDHRAKDARAVKNHATSLKSARRAARPSSKSLKYDSVSRLPATAETWKTNSIDAMENDFKTAGAIAALFEIAKPINTPRENGAPDVQLKPA